MVEVLPAPSEQEAPGGDDYHLRRLLYPYPPPPKISTRTTMISISSQILIALTSFGETQLLVVLSWALADCCVAHSFQPPRRLSHLPALLGSLPSAGERRMNAAVDSSRLSDWQRGPARRQSCRGFRRPAEGSAQKNEPIVYEGPVRSCSRFRAPLSVMAPGGRHGPHAEGLGLTA